MAALEIRKIPGVGRMTELTLDSLGITKCSDVLSKSTEIFIATKESTAKWLISCALGISRAFHEDDDDENRIQKSISTSETFKALSSYNGVKHKILELCDDLAARMEQKSVGGSTLTLNMKTTKFDI